MPSTTTPLPSALPQTARWPQERQRSLIGRSKPDIQQCLTEELNQQHQLDVGHHPPRFGQNSQESITSRLLTCRAPLVSTADQPMRWQTTMAQLLTDQRRITSQYMNRIDPTSHKHCHDYGHSPHDTHHLFACHSQPTTLTVESLRTPPIEAAKLLKMAIDETR